MGRWRAPRRPWKGRGETPEAWPAVGSSCLDRLGVTAWGLTAAVPAGAPGPGRPRGEAPTYVNVPASPCPAKRLHYLGLQLPEAGAGVRGQREVPPVQVSAAAPVDLRQRLASSFRPWDVSCPQPSLEAAAQ
ncbi:uncharacterized protein ACBT57_013213 [Dama dama]